MCADVCINVHTCMYMCVHMQVCAHLHMHAFCAMTITSVNDLGCINNNGGIEMCTVWGVYSSENYTAYIAEYVQVPGHTVASAEILALLDLQPLAVAGHVSG